MFEDQEIGIRFDFPEWWEANKQASQFLWMRAIDPMNPDSRLLLFTLFHDVDTPLSDRLEDAVEIFIREEVADGLSPEVEVVGTAALADGTEAERANISHSGGRDTVVLHRVQVSARETFTYVLVLSVYADEAQRFGRTFDTILSSLETFEPAIYGVPHDRAFIMLLGEPQTMDPALVRETTSHLFVSNVFSGLVRFDSFLRVIPDLAESWEVDETGTIYTFTLRRGIYFHEGRPITAHDFKYSIERASDPELHSDTVPLYLGDIVGMHEKLEGEAGEVAGVEVVDELTLRITIDAPKEYFLAKLTYPASSVVDRVAVEGLGQDWWMQGRINGSGPYQMREWEHGRVVVLERYRGYHTPVELEYLVSPLRTLPGASLLDMYLGEAWDAVFVSPRSLDFVREHPLLSQDLQEFDQFTSFFVVMDTTRPPFDDPKVRRAFAMAVDREMLVEEVLEGGVKLANGLLPPGIPGYHTSLRGIPYDPEMARQLLGESRYGDNLPEIIYTVPRGGTNSIVRFMIDAWEEVLGVEVRTEPVPDDEYFYGLEAVAEHMYSYGWVADYPDPENFLDLLLHSSRHDARYINEEFDNLVEQARSERDWDVRLGLYQQAEQLLMDGAGIIPLYHSQDFVVVRPHVEGFRMLPIGQPDLTRIKLNPLDH